VQSHRDITVDHDSGPPYAGPGGLMIHDRHLYRERRGGEPSGSKPQDSGSSDRSVSPNSGVGWEMGRPAVGQNAGGICRQ
jgi:hypothetical protein